MPYDDINYLKFFSKQSEHNLRGILQTNEEYLARGQSATIEISNIQIPDLPHGSKVSISLTAERDTRNKRSPQGMFLLLFLFRNVFVLLVDLDRISNF